MLIASDNVVQLREIKLGLSKAFKLTDLGEPKSFLGMNIEQVCSKRIMQITHYEYTY